MSGRVTRAPRARPFALVALAVVAVPAAATADDALDLVRAAETRRVETFARAARTVVCIYGDRTLEGGGSGVLISEDGLGLTNFHVVASFLESRRGFGGLSDGRLYPLRILGIDPGGDIVMFKLEGSDRFDHAPLADSDALRVGQPVAAMGNPFLLADDFTPTITVGIISGLHRYQEGQGHTGSLLEYADCIQVSTSINPGNSGGPLFDERGALIGINGRGSFEERGRVNVGLGYAVSINQIKRFLPTLRAGLLCEHGTLGATVRQVGDELIFDAIQDFSPAEQAGIQLGDALEYIAGRRVTTANEYNNIVAILPAGWPVRIVLQRKGTRLLADTRLEPLPPGLDAPFVPDPALNTAEVDRLLSSFHAAAGLVRPPEAVRWDITYAGTSGDRPPVTYRYDRALAGVAATGAAEQRDQLLVAPESAGELDLPTRTVSEWDAITTPLLGTEVSAGAWEAVGGDGLDGRIVAVIEHRASPAFAVRWKFDDVTGFLVGAMIVYRDSANPVRWQAEDPASLGGVACWPRVWTRYAGDDPSGQILVNRMEPLDGAAGEVP